jgi:Nuf2 family
VRGFLVCPTCSYILCKTKMLSTEFSFPILSFSEISSTLSELEIHVTAEELKKINSLKVLEIYEKMISIFIPLAASSAGNSPNPNPR